MKIFERLDCICAAGLIVFFFFPWVTIGGVISVPGYKIPEIAGGVKQMAYALGGARAVSVQELLAGVYPNQFNF